MKKVRLTALLNYYCKRVLDILQRSTALTEDFEGEVCRNPRVNYRAYRIAAEGMMRELETCRRRVNAFFLERDGEDCSDKQVYDKADRAAEKLAFFLN